MLRSHTCSRKDMAEQAQTAEGMLEALKEKILAEHQKTLQRHRERTQALEKFSLLLENESFLRFLRGIQMLHGAEAGSGDVVPFFEAVKQDSKQGKPVARYPILGQHFGSVCCVVDGQLSDNRLESMQGYFRNRLPWITSESIDKEEAKRCFLGVLEEGCHDAEKIVQRQAALMELLELYDLTDGLGPKAASRLE